MAAIASPSQQKVFNGVQHEKFHIAVQATAGAGKSFTLIEALKLIPRFKKAVFLSFSNAIVNELKERVPKNIKASTLHSLGCRMVMSKYRGVKVNENKYFKLALEHYSDKNKDSYKKCFGIQDVCNYARLTLADFNELSLRELCNKFMIDADQEQLLIAEIILVENTKLKKNIAEIDFSDMIYFPSKYPELITEQYDYVFLDEAQDLNNSQAQLVENIIRKPSGRLIFVGDEKQCIYGFTGNEIDSFQKLKDRFGAKQMELTVTYRCAKEIVKLAQTVYPEVIEAWDGSPDGEVRRGDLFEAKEGDMVICRNTKPLVSAFFYFLSRDMKSYIVGKDFEKGLTSLAETIEGYTFERIEQNIIDKLEAYYNELQEQGVKNPDNSPKYIALLEKCEIIRFILQKINKPFDLVSKIQEIFHEDKKAIRLLTAHRSKGLENERVFFIETYNSKKLLPSEYAVLDWQKIQEQNLLFVVYTRAKKEFVFIDYNDQKNEF